MGSAVPSNDLPSSLAVPANDLPDHASGASASALDNQARAQTSVAFAARPNADQLMIYQKEAQDEADALRRAVASKDPVEIGTRIESLKAANRNLMTAGGEPIPTPDLYPPKQPAAPASAAPNVNDGGSSLDSIPMLAQRLGSATALGGLGLAAVNSPAMYKALLAKKAVDKIFQDRVDPTINPTESVVVEPTSSPWPGAKTSVVTSTPEVNVDGTPVVKSPEAKEVGHNEFAHQKKVRAERLATALRKIGVNPDAAVAAFPDVDATQSGLVVTAEQAEKLRQEQQAREDALRNRAQTQSGIEQKRALGIANEAGATWQDLLKRGEQLAASADIESQKLGNIFKQKAIQWWKTGISPLQNLSGRVGTMAAGTGFALPGAVEKMQSGDVYGGAQELGAGTAVGAALSYAPQKIIPAINAAFQGGESINRAAKGDYLGSGLSAFGALAPIMAPLAVAAPEVAAPLALGAATIPPTINYLRDWYRRHYSPTQGNLPTNNTQ